MRTDPTPHERAVLDAFFAGDCTPERWMEVSAILDRFPEEGARLAAWREAARRHDTWPGGIPDAAVLYEAWRRRLAGTDLVATQPVPPVVIGLGSAQIPAASPDSAWTSRGRRTGTVRMPVRRSWAYGAMVVTAACVVAVVAITRGPSPQRGESTARTYRTSTGERMALTLADGSHVILAPRTVLRVDGDFGHIRRAVALRGQAYFDVRGAPQPFVVRAGRARVDVIGTAFDVRQYDDDPAARIAVVSGKVAVAVVSTGGSVRKQLVLTAGMLGRVTDSTVTATDAAADGYVGWTDGQMTFRNVPVSDVLATLGRWYDFRFTLADSTLARRHIIGTFDYGSSAELLSALKTLLDVRMTFDGRNVTLHPRQETRTVPTRGDARDSLIYFQPRENGR